ncbi:class I SAM-dependent methyltransferase [Brevundimonas sp. TWP2-3-4b2]|uniref:class I SAM-dependent methyltransferase n=1 Tax=Brevundimonas sp. TWP2-3-4b2 TaxID=2804595 RepID=UPI003CFAEB30
MTDGWDHSAEAWIAVIGDDGDWGRRHVLDAPMLARLDAGRVREAVDIGCGEGRFCRMMRDRGIRTIGIDPTAALIERAHGLDPYGDYRIMAAEALDLGDASVDLAVFYLSLIDIADLPAAIAEAWRVVRPGGRVLIANLQGFNTAAVPLGWTHEPDGTRRFCIDHYMDERPVRTEWQGISIVNWHRPFSVYMQGFLDQGFTLRHFSEPRPTIQGDKADRYLRAPNFLVVEWERPR